MTDDSANPFGQVEADGDVPDFGTTPPVVGSSMKSPETVSKLEQLRIREAELLSRQQLLRDSRSEIIAVPNYPAIWPVIVFDPVRDLGAKSHSVARLSLYGLIAVCCSTAYNMLAVLSVWKLPGYNHLRSFIFAGLQGFGTAYVCYNYSFLKLYASCRKKDIPFSWIITQFLIIAWCVYLSIGFPTSGCVGLATFLDLIAKSPSGFSIFVAFINTALIISATVLQTLTLYRAQQYQKVSGSDDVAASASLEVLRV
jgi:hypothetical protein